MNDQLEAFKTPNGVVLRGQPTRYIPGIGKPSLVNKLCLIMQGAGTVPKTGWNPHHKYKYVTEDGLTEAVRAGLVAQGVMLIFGIEAISIELVEIGQEGKKRDGYSSVILTSHMLIDGDSGEQIIYQTGGHAAKSDDKGLYSCMTGAQKYALQKLFLIPSEEGDPENDHNASFIPTEEAQPAPARYRNAGEDPAVQARMAREEQQFEREQPSTTSPAPAGRRQRGGVATAAQRGGMVAEPVAPEEQVRTGYPDWCDAIKNCGEAHKGKTLAWVGLNDMKSLKIWQKDWHPKPTRPGGSIAPAHAALREALDQSVKEPVTAKELEAIVAEQEGA